jgi:hypothetical protein
MRNPERLLKILDEYELDMFTNQLFESVTHELFKVWHQHFRTLIKMG